MQKINVQFTAMKISVGLMAGLLIGSFTFAGENASHLPDAAASDPAKLGWLGWMVGSPPPADRILRFDDGSYFRSPAMRWSVSNFRQLRGTG